jgi:hypothetical protein
MQFIAPAVCLLMGVGAAALVERLPRPKHRLIAACLFSLALAAGGMGMARRYVLHPFNDDYDVKAREFAKRFWPEQARGAEVACMVYDLRVYNHQWVNLYRSMYLCNQMIYSPPRRRGRCLRTPRFEAVSALHPLRCVLYQGSATTDPEVVAWLAAMKRRFELRRTEHIVVDMSRPIGPKLEETVVVFEFIPRSDVAVARSASPETARR